MPGHFGCWDCVSGAHLTSNSKEAPLAPGVLILVDKFLEILQALPSNQSTDESSESLMKDINRGGSIMMHLMHPD